MMVPADHPAIIMPPPILWLLAVGVGALLQWLIPWRVTGIGWQGIGLVLVAVAFFLSVWALWSLRQAKTPVDPLKTPRAIVTFGPYRYSRNPIYVALIFSLPGIGFLTGWLWIAILAVPFWAILQWGVVRPEEVFLRQKFGNEYERYCARTRRWV
ncbi:hypothetical protein TPY_1799 [Sulfobacillus acidophilus TPY]|uniref:Isoprenylcysteine carboxylmethyltransferase family protein n=1 Tax=Sulfobacillus acidophilus (strain ATCC 700253 / DSM 10332 / NAL) TaxID=679936 RepID=G8TS79_SULAD|nr:hypothetical protein TPY_1799 [Sulfobacillus acidophilus TPY]AEW05491.1 hypothetical protein Sulac_2001 [Sulfobacillus acidophilus DSM 10332]